MSTKRLKIEVVCDSCGGSGLYRGFMERPDEAVVCVGCGGTGRMTLSGLPFKGRTRKRGVKKIRFGSGLIIDSPDGWFSYEDFLKRVPEKTIVKAKKRAPKKTAAKAKKRKVKK